MKNPPAHSYSLNLLSNFYQKTILKGLKRSLYQDKYQKVVAHNMTPPAFTQASQTFVMEFYQSAEEETTVTLHLHH